MAYCKPWALMLVALITNGACHAQQNLVSPQEIQTTWVGKSVIGTTGAGAPVLLKLQADGTASVQAGKTSDSGTWRLSDSGYCATWKTIAQELSAVLPSKKAVISGRCLIPMVLLIQ